MAKIEKLKPDEAWRYDLLYPVLKDAFRILYISYQKLHADKQNNPYTKPEKSKRWFLEDAITDDLIKDEYEFDKDFDYSLIPQYKNILRKSRIDIAIHWRLTFGKYINIEIECKLLNKSNLDYIIKGGIHKFKANKYAENAPLAGMLNYNTSGTIPKNIGLLNSKIDQKISPSDVLNSFKMIDNYHHTYISRHQRVSNSSIDLYTIAFDFKDVIRNSDKEKNQL